MTRILLASRNIKKIEELRRILAPLTDIEVIGLSDVPSYPEAPETGATFEENALAKARDAVTATGMITIAEDSGLSIDALNGMPGVLSARWSGQHGNDTANNTLVLAQLTDIPDDRRTAAFICSAALITPTGQETVVQATWPGHITRTPRGTNGFGYDPIFIPTGQTRTSAELNPEEKDAHSHRAQALRQLVPHIQALQGT